MDINEIILEKVRRVKHVALDMDGTIYNGGTLFPFTIGFLDKMNLQIMNNCLLIK